MRDEAPNIKTEDVIMCCLERLLHNSEVYDRRVWNNSGIIISRGKAKKRRESLLRSHFVEIKSPGTEPKAFCFGEYVLWKVLIHEGDWFTVADL
jgi:hypothetical protein